MSQHSKNCITNQLPLYNHIRDNGGWINFNMILINTIYVENSLYAKKVCRELLEENQNNNQPLIQPSIEATPVVVTPPVAAARLNSIMLLSLYVLSVIVA